MSSLGRLNAMATSWDLWRARRRRSLGVLAVLALAMSLLGWGAGAANAAGTKRVKITASMVSVATNDETGGSGANFLVYWEGPSDAHSLLTETVMVGHLGSGHVAFTSRGVELDRRPDPASFTDEPAPAP